MVQFEYVDLGLPSGLKWAKCNVGAEKETDYGDYFMWGSTIPNTADECNWESYTHCNGSYDTLTKYNTSTLIDNTDSEWVEDFNGTGVNGRKFTSKTDTSKYIFIPVAGVCGDGSVYNVNYYGYVRSSSLGTSYPANTWFLYFNSGSCYMSYSNRYDGQTVRGVMK